jgi:hypothetical membrane protein
MQKQVACPPYRNPPGGQNVVGRPRRPAWWAGPRCRGCKTEVVPPSRRPESTAGGGPVLWLLSAQYFLVQVAVAADWPSRYSWTGNTISDLGSTRCAAQSGRPVCSPLHLLMNASFVALGLTMLAGAVLIGRRVDSGSRAATTGFACLGLAGLGTIVVGLYPENTVAGLHAGGAALPFVLGNLGVVLLGIGLRLARTLLALTFAAGVVGLIGLALFLSHTYIELGIGGMERVTAYPQDVWLIAIGAYMLARRVPPAVAVRRNAAG